VTFVDHDRDALAVIEKNLEATKLSEPGDRTTARLIRRDAITFLANATHFDLAFVDPPYAYEQWPKIFRHLDVTTAVLESNRVVEPEGPYDSYRSYRYGGTLVHIVRRQLDVGPTGVS